MADSHSTTAQRWSPAPGLTRPRWLSWWRGVEGFQTLAFGPSTSPWHLLDPSLSPFAGPRSWPAAHRGTDAVAGRRSLSLPPSLSLSLYTWCGGRGGRAELPECPLPFLVFFSRERGIAPFFISFSFVSWLITQSTKIASPILNALFQTQINNTTLHRLFVPKYAKVRFNKAQTNSKVENLIVLGERLNESNND